MVARRREFGKGLWRQPANERMVQLAFVITASLAPIAAVLLLGDCPIPQNSPTTSLRRPRAVKVTALPRSGRVWLVAIGERLAIL
jgi:hypothetical protein